MCDTTRANRQQSKAKYHIAALITTIFWGASFVFTRVLLDNNLQAVEIFLYRFIIAYLLILIISHKRMWANSLRDEILLALCGITSGSIYFIAENVALKYTLVSNVALITSTSPLLTTLLIGLFYRNERPGKGVYLGSMIALIGVGCVIFKDGFSLEIMPFGDLLALSASLSFAFYSILLRKVNVVYDALFITRKTFFYGLVTAVPFLMFEPEVCGLDVLLRPEVLLNFLFLAIFCSVVGFFLWATATDKIGAIKTNNYLYLQPVFTLLLAYFVLNESISILGYLGCLLVLAGLYVSDKFSGKRAV